MNEQNIFIVRTGEVALKGMNKPYFERKLVERIRTKLSSVSEALEQQGEGKIEVYRKEGLVFIRSPKSLPPCSIRISSTLFWIKRPCDRTVPRWQLKRSSLFRRSLPNPSIHRLRWQKTASNRWMTPFLRRHWRIFTQNRSDMRRLCKLFKT